MGERVGKHRVSLNSVQGSDRRDVNLRERSWLLPHLDDWLPRGGSAITDHFFQNGLSGQEARYLIILHSSKQPATRKTFLGESVGAHLLFGESESR